MAALSFVIGTVVLAYVLMSCPVSGLGRLVAPESQAIVVLYMIFSIRPMFADRFESRSIYGYIPSPEAQDAAILVGIVGMLAFAIGVFLLSVSPGMKIKLGDARRPSDESLRIPAVGVLIVAVGGVVLYFLVMLLLAGSEVVDTLKGGRSVDVVLAGVPEIVLMIPMFGTIATAVFLVSKRSVKLGFGEIGLLISSSGLSLFVLSQLGNRRFIIPALLIPLIAALVRRPVRIKVWHVVTGCLVFLFIATVPMVRSAGARLPGENLFTASWRHFGEVGVGGTLEPVFASFDTEMLDYVGVVVDQSNQPGWLGLGYGRGTLVEFLSRPLPRSIDLFGAPFSDRVLGATYGGPCGSPVCPVASTPGVLFFDGGFVAVVIGMVGFGLLLRWLSLTWADNRQYGVLKVSAVVVASGFALIATRTNTVHAIWWAIYAELLMMGVVVAFSLMNSGGFVGRSRASLTKEQESALPAD
ncbi:hypothetical protein QM583_21540 [Gordonia alkanivorans]|uniref:hypothetical protein n=1 Tax=Gordonia alkanivorans TaxID=84096 RepID=UPI0024B83BD1|nr:hypothetical protein [Gordonia alkanivorans]MDJ0029637.1 hypothetical protein [Gordonia alkanivorans]